jgi:hypothetical protein
LTQTASLVSKSKEEFSNQATPEPPRFADERAHHLSPQTRLQFNCSIDYAFRMPDFPEDRALAPKVFFIDPAPSIVSESFIETAFSKGFEIYSIADDLSGDLLRKVRLLVETYPDLILFFTIDRKGSLKAWIEYLRELQNCHDNCVRIGVLYSEKNDLIDRLIKKTFNFDIGITAGSIALGDSFRKNQLLLLKVLEANQAMGRRKMIRLKCDSGFRMNYFQKQTQMEANLLDLSVSHFSAAFDQNVPQWEVGTTIRSVQLRLGGRLLMVNARVAIKRKAENHTSVVFIFSPESEHPGQEEAMRSKVSEVICAYYQSKMKTFLEKRAEVSEDSPENETLPLQSPEQKGTNKE